jgi:hypothetical protein
MNQNRTTLIVGILLILIGGVFLLGQVTGLVQIGTVWPLVIIGIGALFFVGMAAGGKVTGPLAIPGTIIIAVGLILLVQNWTGWWETWSYAWALIVASVGLGIAIAGAWSDNPNMRRSGLELAKVGLILFLVFGAIMEFIFHLTGISSRGSLLFWSVLLILVGLYQLGTRVFRLVFRPENARHDDRDLFGPFFLIGIGILAVMFSQGWIDSNDLLRMISLWPLLLIAIGLQLVVGRRTAWVSAIIGVLLVAGMLVAVTSGEQLGLKSSLPFISTGSFNWGGNERINGNGEVIEVTKEISGINAVSLEAIGSLEIIQGQNESLMVEAESNLIEYMTFDSSGNRLTIGLKRGYNFNPREPIQFTLTVKDLTRIDVSGVGVVNVPRLVTDQLRIGSSGVTRVEINDLQADSLTVDVSGTGKVDITGTVIDLDIDASGATQFLGSDLESQVANIEASGAAKVTAWITEKLDAEASGAGSISYFGSPKVNIATSGAGSVRNAGEK